MQKKSFNINIGMVSFLMIFIVLSMVTFSVLTLVTAKNQYNSSLKSVTHQENYSDDELVSHFNLTIDEIEQKEIEILSLLKNNDNVKLLRKNKNDIYRIF